ncbi:MAG: metal-dependent hydrolase [Lysobacterales bacterium]|nr:MAG: metal-dependent hydrolase [Xanthomonadales bacterium]
MALGAAVGTAVLGRRIGPRAALWGAAFGTLPDLDVLVSHGDPVRDFTFHRGVSHSFFWLTVASPFLAALAATVERKSGAGFRSWLLLAWLALVTHPMLDAFTVYGTQLLLPFSDHPFGIGSVFIIDPLYTVPLLVGLATWLVLRRRDPVRAGRWNAAGLVASTLYLGWTVAAQSHVESLVHRTAAAASHDHDRVLVTPTPFNTLLWRVVVMDETGYREGFRSLLDERDTVTLQFHATEPRLLDDVRDDWSVQRLAWFSKGFYGVHRADPGLRIAQGSPSTMEQLLGLVDEAQATGTVPTARPGIPIVMTDLRMGQTPWFVFSFVVAEQHGAATVPAPVRQVPTERPPAAVLGRLWRRIWDEEAPF